MNKPRQSLARAFACAYRGIGTCARTSRNFRIQLAVAALALAAGVVLQLLAWEWCLVVGCIAAVLAAEAFNSALEKIVDELSPEYNEQAKAVKDMAAGAVLLLAHAAVIIGVIIFIRAGIRVFT